MALFGKKTSDNGPDAADAPAVGAPDPAKARRWFEHAKAMQEATNYEYAMQLWLKGLAFDPTNMDALESFFTAGASFFATAGPKGRLTKETKGAVDGKKPSDKFLKACLEYVSKPTDPVAAVDAVKAAVDADLTEQAYFVGERAVALVSSDPKPKRATAEKLMDTLESAGIYDLAEKAGNSAVRADPSDGDLQARVRNMAAQATMNQGGFDTAEEGGFRKNIRNLDAQRQLEEADRIVKSESVKDRLVNDARAALKERPDDGPTREKYFKALRDRGNPDDLKLAGQLAMKTYEESKAFQWRQYAGEIRIKMARAKLNQYRRAADNGDAKAAELLPKAERKFIELEAEELRLSVEAYPTNLGLKYELGRREFALGNYEPAVALFQEAKNDAKHRSAALVYLGRSFAAIGLNDEAIETLRHALEKHDDQANEQGMDLRYTLMDALLAKGTSDKDAAALEEADKLASGIVMQQITFRDIRAKRDEIKKALAELKG